MKLVNMCDMIEHDGYYKQEILNSILDCLTDSKKLSKLTKKLKVGDGDLERYVTFFYKLKQYFSLTGNIVEFGYGDFPIMSFLVDHEQQIQGSGTITAYGKNYSEQTQPPLGNIIFKDELIKKETCLGKCDLLFGIYPCHGSFDMIDKANSLGIDFFLVMCDCPPFYGDYHYLYEYAGKGIDDESELIVDYGISKVEPIIIKCKKPIYN